MSHLSDKELDRLSREAAEQFDVEGNTSGWEALEQKLNKEMPGEDHLRKRKWWRWLGLFLLIISISGLLLGLYNDQHIGNKKHVAGNERLHPGNPVSPNQDENTAPIPGSGKDLPSGKPAVNQDLLSNQQAVNEDNGPLNKQVDTKAIDQEYPKDNAANTKNRPAVKTSDGKVSQEIENTNININNNQPRTKNIEKDRSARFFPNKPVNEAYNSKPGLENIHKPGSKIVDREDSSEPLLLIRSATPFQFTHTAKHINVAGNTIEKTNYPGTDISGFNQAKPSSKQPIKKPVSTRNRPIELGLIVGSDFSNVRFKGGDKPGYNIGISIGYNLNDRWQINTGAIYTTKRYFAKGEDYKPLNDYWTNYVDMDYLSGECSMWEVPLLIRYNLTTGNRGKWFASTGLSSYLMKREKYEYYYTQNGVYQNKYKDYPSDKKYFMAILNFSAGYEKKINDRFSLQVEPYIKMPLKGVGYGRMQLNSMGTNFSLKLKMGR